MPRVINLDVIKIKLKDNKREIQKPTGRPQIIFTTFLKNGMFNHNVSSSTVDSIW